MAPVLDDGTNHIRGTFKYLPKQEAETAAVLKASRSVHVFGGSLPFSIKKDQVLHDDANVGNGNLVLIFVLISNKADTRSGNSSSA